jgi:hypothetical protein
MAQLSAGKVMAMANQPTLHELSGNGIHVTYATSSLQGQPQFNYHDAFQAKNFTGNQIQTADTVLGRLVTVFLIQTYRQRLDDFHAAGPDREFAAVEIRQHHDGRHYDPAQIRDRQTAAGNRPSFILPLVLPWERSGRGLKGRGRAPRS